MVTSNRVKAYGALAGSFLLGAFAAGAGYHVVAERRLDDPFEVRRVKAMSRELDLRSDQETKVLDIFKKHGPERQRLLREQVATCGAPMEAHRERIDGEIRGVLDATQRGKFEAMRAAHRHRVFGTPAQSGKKP